MAALILKVTLTLLALAAVQVTWVPVRGDETAAAQRNATLQRLNSIERTVNYVAGVIRHATRNMERYRQRKLHSEFELIKEKFGTLKEDLDKVSEKVKAASNSEPEAMAENIRVLKATTREFHETLKNVTSDMKVTARSLKGQSRTQIDRSIRTLERGGVGLMERVKRLTPPVSRREDSRAAVKNENTTSGNQSSTESELRFRSLIRRPGDDVRLARQELVPGPGRSLLDMARMETYLDRCPSCMVRTESYQCPLHGQALDMQKWAKQLQDLVSFGCAIPDDCDGNKKCCISSDPEVQRAISSVTKTLRDLYTTIQKSCTKCNKILQDEARPDEWATWGSWGSCDVTCGTTGRRRRERQCVRPISRERSNRCSGPAVDTGRCPAMPACETIQWGSWGSWSSCDVTCGRDGTRKRERDCMSFPSRQRSNRCSGRAEEMGRCPAMAACETIQWGSWGSWSSCDVTCGRDGTRKRERDCMSFPSRQRSNRCSGRAEETGRCPAMAACETIQWGSWGSWSSCDVTCGRDGTRKRERDCMSFPSRQRSNRCSGRAEETGRCPAMAACETIQWGGWGSWSSCDVTCGLDGTRTRERQCMSFPSRQRSNRCSGGSATEQGTCPLAPCPIKKPEWASWGPWSSCSVTCDRGVMYRRRSCQRTRDDPVRSTGCVGDGEDRRSCDTRVPCCVDGNWSSWSSWGSCSKTCGRGQAVKRRTCSNPAPKRCGKTCPGSAVATRVCGLDRECCVDGNWGQWLGWSACSVTCGDGVQTRRRRCDDPAANFCGKRCLGNAVTSRSCNNGECCVDGNWSNWGRWTECSASCGSGRRQRERRCSNPSPSACGRSCPGLPIEAETCQASKPCEICVDGNWGSWQRWSACSVSCGSGRRIKRRECDNPPRTSCGKPCPGSSEQAEVCRNPGRDGNWGVWGAWSSCSASCGPGEKTRRRICDNPAPDGCGFPCMGQDRDKRTCNERECCVDGNWGHWQSWSSCSVTCGRGERQRERFCDSPAANYCGERCLGRANDIESCDSGRPCCVDGNWGSWTAWSSCSATCGEAQRMRTRECNSPAANECGRPCPGDAEETKTELCGMISIDGMWSTWQSWSACSSTCGVGARTRVRDCNNPRANPCGRDCAGISLERETCVGSEGTCDCELRAWTAWAAWGSCSKTCGYGVRERNRECAVMKEGRDCGFGLGSCQAGASSEVGQCLEQLDCQDATWGQWGDWGACLCSTGTRTRQRQCFRQLPGSEVTVVTPNLCTGDEKDDQPCTPPQRCPDCFTTCAGKPDGQYPTCDGCGNTVVCSRGRPQVFKECEKGAVWDAFDEKCVYPPSPSCMIHDCCRSCTGKPDGIYQDCNNCNSYIQCTGGEMRRSTCPGQGEEWNQLTKRCEPGPSPTCRREFTQSGYGGIDDDNDGDIELATFNRERGIIIGGGFRRPRNLVTHNRIATLYVERAGKIGESEPQVTKIRHRIATLEGTKIGTDDSAPGNTQGGGGTGDTGSFPQGMVAPGRGRDGVTFIAGGGQGGRQGRGDITVNGSSSTTTYVYGSGSGRTGGAGGSGGTGSYSGSGTLIRVNTGTSGTGTSGTRTYVTGTGGSGTRTYVTGTGTSGTGTSGTRTFVTGTGNSGTRTYVSGTGGSGTRTFVTGTGTSGTGTSGTRTFVTGTGNSGTRTYVSGTGGSGTRTFVTGTGTSGTGTSGTRTFVTGTGTSGTGTSGTRTFVTGTGNSGTRTYVSGTGTSGTRTYVSGTGTSGTGGSGTGGSGTRTFVTGTGNSGTRTYVSGTGGSGTRTYVSGTGTSGTRTYVSGTGTSGTRTYVSGTRTGASGSSSGASGTVSLSGNVGSLSGGEVPVNVFTVPDCVRDCQGAIPGKYPSCMGCEFYVICTRNGRIRQRKCQSNRKWDDKSKKCTRYSTTCR